MENNSKLAYAICTFLKTSIASNVVDEDNAEGLNVAIDCIAEAFNIDLNDKIQESNLSIAPATLESIFKVFQNTQALMLKTKSAVPDPSGETKKKADSLKGLGNKKMAEKEFDEAIELYGKAIALDPYSAVFYANRAAAYSQISDHENAVKDSKKAVEVDPEYSKAYSRMGHAQFCLGDYQDAVESYELGLKLDPNNVTMKQSLASAKQKLNELDGGDRSVETTAAPSGSAGGNPLAGMDFSSMMSNPAMMNMASQMMNNPNMASFLSNPAISSMAQNLMSNPSALESLLKNPDMANMASMMGKKD